MTRALIRDRTLRPAAAALVAALALLGLTACGNGGGESADSGDGVVHVVAATDVWGSVVEQVAGTLSGSTVQISSIIDDPAADPHSYEASTQNQLAVSKADLVVENGGGYDDFLNRMVSTSGSRSAVVLNAVDISGFTSSSSGELNEHVWYDFPTVAEVASQIADALAKADPADLQTFQTNLAAFDQQLQAMEQTEATIKSAHGGEGVAITEPVPLYLLTACGLVDKTPAEFSEAVEDGTDVAPSVLKETEELFGNGSVALLVYNEQTSGAETQAVLAAAKQGDVPAVGVTETLPKGQDYVSWMTANLAAVSAALG